MAQQSSLLAGSRKEIGVDSSQMRNDYHSRRLQSALRKATGGIQPSVCTVALNAGTDTDAGSLKRRKNRITLDMIACHTAPHFHYVSSKRVLISCSVSVKLMASTLPTLDCKIQSVLRRCPPSSLASSSPSFKYYFSRSEGEAMRLVTARIFILFMRKLLRSSSSS